MKNKLEIEYLETELTPPKYSVGQECYMFDEYCMIRVYEISERKQTTYRGKLEWVYKLSDNKLLPKDTDFELHEEHIYLSIEQLLLFKLNQFLRQTPENATSITINY